jgi:ABC-type branched-subunit amino acid transport system substrate-binding protein
VVERHNQLLFYPVQYEGLELSPNIVYAGAAPNQQIIPAVKWCFDHLGKRFFLVGSDYVFPRTANAIIKDQVGALGGEIAGEDYILLGR